jgi:kynurenine formamidase
MRRLPRFVVASLLSVNSVAPGVPGGSSVVIGADAPPSARRLPADRLVDLTHAFDAHTIYWPTARGFELDPVARGTSEGGWWYAANDFCAAEHGGTHLDAPFHFAEHGWTVDQIPLARLTGPAAVVDVSARATADPDAMVTVADLDAFEAAHGRFEAGTIVLLRTGFGTRWGDRARYLGTAVPGDVKGLRFPGLDPDAARRLVERGAGAVGIDTASIDRGRSADFRAHQVLGTANVPVFENLARLDALPPRGATFIGLPMKIGGGSGAPLRAIAVLP